MPTLPDAAHEAERLLALHTGPDRLARALEILSRQFVVIQARSQLLLTLATITLTITGFSGPRMASSGPVARWGLILGLGFVLCAVVVLLSTLRIRYLTQLLVDDPLRSLTVAIDYRNRKTAWFGLEVALLIIGLACYVTAVIAYLTVLPPGSVT